MLLPTCKLLSGTGDRSTLSERRGQGTKYNPEILNNVLVFDKINEVNNLQQLIAEEKWFGDTERIDEGFSDDKLKKDAAVWWFRSCLGGM